MDQFQRTVVELSTNWTLISATLALRMLVSITIELAMCILLITLIVGPLQILPHCGQISSISSTLSCRLH